MPNEMDQHAAEELKLYIDNDGDLYRQQTTSIYKNLMLKRAKGVYNQAGAVKLFGYLAESGAKKYAKEFAGDPWNVLFPTSVRKAVAEALAADFITEADLGNYDQLLPLKYQAKH